MRWRHVHELQRSRRRRQFRDDQPLVIDRHADQLRARRLEDLPGSEVAGLLDGDAIARIEQHARDKVQPLLRAGHDDDLIGIAIDGACPR